MTEPGEEAANARSLGLALLDASRIYEGFVIPKYEEFVVRAPRAACGVGGSLPIAARLSVLSLASAVFSVPHIRSPMLGRC